MQDKLNTKKLDEIKNKYKQPSTDEEYHPDANSEQYLNHDIQDIKEIPLNMPQPYTDQQPLKVYDTDEYDL